MENIYLSMDFDEVEYIVKVLGGVLAEYSTVLIQGKNEEDGTPDDVILIRHKDDDEPCLAIRPVY